MESNPERWKELHDKAVREGRDSYVEEETGAIVFTEAFHLKRGKCCGSKCRHCPYEHINVPKE